MKLSLVTLAASSLLSKRSFLGDHLSQEDDGLPYVELTLGTPPKGALLQMTNWENYISVPNSNVTLPGQSIDYNVDDSSTAKIDKYTDKGYSAVYESIGIDIWNNDYEPEDIKYGTDLIKVGIEKNGAKPFAGALALMEVAFSEKLFVGKGYSIFKSGGSGGFFMGVINRDLLASELFSRFKATFDDYLRFFINSIKIEVETNCGSGNKSAITQGNNYPVAMVTDKSEYMRLPVEVFMNLINALGGWYQQDIDGYVFPSKNAGPIKLYLSSDFAINFETADYAVIFEDNPDYAIIEPSLVTSTNDQIIYLGWKFFGKNYVFFDYLDGDLYINTDIKPSATFTSADMSTVFSTLDSTTTYADYSNYIPTVTNTVTTSPATSSVSLNTAAAVTFVQCISQTSSSWASSSFLSSSSSLSLKTSGTASYSSESISSGSFSFSGYSNYTDSLSSESTSSASPVTSTVTKDGKSTAVVTVTSCSEDQCSEVPITTGVTVIDTTIFGSITKYTTYCPLTSESATKSEMTTQSQITHTDSIASIPEFTPETIAEFTPETVAETIAESESPPTTEPKKSSQSNTITSTATISELTTQSATKPETIIEPSKTASISSSYEGSATRLAAGLIFIIGLLAL